jgi:hypothetical protein
MEPRHPSAKHFQTTGLFQDLESFANLEGRIERLGSRTSLQYTARLSRDGSSPAGLTNSFNENLKLGRGTSLRMVRYER